MQRQKSLWRYRGRRRARPDGVAVLVNNKEQAWLLRVWAIGCQILPEWAENDLSDNNSSGWKSVHDAMQMHMEPISV